jgi:hypothetical protein
LTATHHSTSSSFGFRSLHWDFALDPTGLTSGRDILSMVFGSGTGDVRPLLLSAKCVEFSASGTNGGGSSSAECRDRPTSGRTAVTRRGRGSRRTSGTAWERHGLHVLAANDVKHVLAALGATAYWRLWWIGLTSGTMTRAPTQVLHANVTGVAAVRRRKPSRRFQEGAATVPRSRPNKC